MIKVSCKNGDSHRDDPTSTLPVSTDDIEKLLEFQIESKQVPSTRKRLWEGSDDEGHQEQRIPQGSRVGRGFPQDRQVIAILAQRTSKS